MSEKFDQGKKLRENLEFLTALNPEMAGPFEALLKFPQETQDKIFEDMRIKMTNGMEGSLLLDHLQSLINNEFLTMDASSDLKHEAKPSKETEEIEKNTTEYARRTIEGAEETIRRDNIDKLKPQGVKRYLN